MRDGFTEEPKTIEEANKAWEANKAEADKTRPNEAIQREVALEQLDPNKLDIQTTAQHELSQASEEEISDILGTKLTPDTNFFDAEDEELKKAIDSRMVEDAKENAEKLAAQAEQEKSKE